MYIYIYIYTYIGNWEGKNLVFIVTAQAAPPAPPLPDLNPPSAVLLLEGRLM